jgi:DNA-binding IclR family transcriptional regulator
MSLNYVHRDEPTKRYSLGYSAFRLGRPGHVAHSVARFATPFLKRLAHGLNGTAYMAGLSGPEIRVHAEEKGYGREESKPLLSVVADAHATACGKVLLAHRPVIEVRELYAECPLRSHTRNTITNFSVLAKELQATRRRGFAVDDQEYLVGVRSVAVPLVSPDGLVTFAVGIASPVDRLPTGHIDAVAAHIRSVTRDIAAYIVDFGPRRAEALSKATQRRRGHPRRVAKVKSIRKEADKINWSSS